MVARRARLTAAAHAQEAQRAALLRMLDSLFPRRRPQPSGFGRISGFHLLTSVTHTLLPCLGAPFAFGEADFHKNQGQGNSGSHRILRCWPRATSRPLSCGICTRKCKVFVFGISLLCFDCTWSKPRVRNPRVRPAPCTAVFREHLLMPHESQALTPNSASMSSTEARIHQILEEA